jgi:hypothetical protein
MKRSTNNKRRMMAKAGLKGINGSVTSMRKEPQSSHRGVPSEIRHLRCSIL